MTKLPWWKRSLMAFGAVVAAVAALAGQPRLGSSAEPVEPFQGQPFQYAGSLSCKGCHGLSKDLAIQISPKSVAFIQLDEYKTWEIEDKHSIAYKRLLEPNGRGQRMARLLKVDVTQPGAGCLGCHSASTSEIKDRQGDQFDRSEGVSCENCHGPLSGWSFDHTQIAFRTKSPEAWAKVGFNDLRSPDRQADKCLSCHIGNSDEGKVVTHEMYAAGHPPLPSIEVATFANSIPRHWWLLSERKSPELRAQLGFKDGQLEQTKLAIVGAAVALKTSMKLLADEATAAEKAAAPGQEWPDYARFDCWSCHHDLKRESWRQARGYQGPPGRVPVSEWPLAIVDLGIERLAMDDPAALALRSELQRFRQVLRDQANSRPFGKKVSIAKAAKELSDWSDVLIKKLTAASYDQAIARKLLRKLVEKAELSTPDYDSARHIAWTIKLLVEELGDKLPNKEPIAAILKQFDEGLKLDLPAGKKYEIEDQLDSALQIIGDYEPATFQKQLKELLGLLPPG
jgi:Cytochrome c554 and c-prime